MSDKKVHLVHAAVGSGYAVYQAWGQELYHLFFEALGGALGGCIGGMLPSTVGVPVALGHQKSENSPVNEAIKDFYRKNLGNWQHSLRNSAMEQRKKREQTDSFWTQIWHRFLEAFYHICSGFLAGLGASQVSCSAFDYATSNSLPSVD